jgi:hypothetical protein
MQEIDRLAEALTGDRTHVYRDSSSAGPPDRIGRTG